MWKKNVHLFFKKIIFNWRIIALQCCVGFCYTWMWINHRYAYVPSFWTCPPTPSHSFMLSQSTEWKRPWCWEGLGAGGEGDNRGWDSWMASPTRWRPGLLRFMGSQRVGHDWATELNWTEKLTRSLCFPNVLIRKKKKQLITVFFCTFFSLLSPPATYCLKSKESSI